jgi:DNA (cytosine-5)-methyltransferase 1
MRRLSSVSLFSGAGGLDYGLEEAGFDVIAVFECDPCSVETLRLNQKWSVFSKKIFSSTDVRKLIGAGVGRVDLLAAGPPCQPFSHAASWANGQPNGFADARANTVRHFMNIVEQLLPKVFLLENVPGFARGARSASDYVKRRIQQINRRCGTNYVASTSTSSLVSRGRI